MSFLSPSDEDTRHAAQFRREPQCLGRLRHKPTQVPINGVTAEVRTSHYLSDLPTSRLPPLILSADLNFQDRIMRGTRGTRNNLC